MAELGKQSSDFYQLRLEHDEATLLNKLDSNATIDEKIDIFHKLGELFVNADIEKSITYFKEAADLGSADDMFNCAYFSKKLSELDGTEKVRTYRKLAKKYLKLAIQKDHKKSIKNYLKWYIDENKRSKALIYLNSQIQESNINLMTILASEFLKDNKNIALSLYKKAADHCKKNEAMKYADQIIKQNTPEGIIYYKISVSKGSVKACFRLANIFKANDQLNVAIEYFKCAIILIEQNNSSQNTNEKDMENYIEAHNEIGKMYFKLYQDNIESNPNSSFQFLKLAEFYFWKIFKQKQEAAQNLFSIIELEKDEMTHNEYLKFIYQLGLSGATGAARIYYSETNDYEYIKEAIKVNSEDPFTNYVYGMHEKNIDCIKKAYELGLPEASYEYAVYLLSNFEVEESFKALNYAYQNGISKAATILGILYLNNWIDSENEGGNREKALHILEDAKDDERAKFIIKELETGQAPHRNSSIYSVFI